MKEKYEKIFKRFSPAPVENNGLPDVSDFADSSKIDVAGLENKLRPSMKHNPIETLFSKIESDGSDLDKMRVEISHLIKDDSSNSLPEKEFASIYTNIFECLLKGKSRAMYVNGISGSGKTKTIEEVVSELQSSSRQREVPIFNYIKIDGISIGDSKDFYVEVWKQLSGDELVPGAASESLNFYFKNVKMNTKRPVILFLDDIDALSLKGKDILYSIFNWTTFDNAKLCVVVTGTISELPKSLLGKDVLSRMKIVKIPFDEAEYPELEKIVNFRLKGVNKSYFYVNPDTGRLKFIDRHSSEEPLNETDENMVKVRLKISSKTIDLGSKKIAEASLS